MKTSEPRHTVAHFPVRTLVADVFVDDVVVDDHSCETVLPKGALDDLDSCVLRVHEESRVRLLFATSVSPVALHYTAAV